MGDVYDNLNSLIDKMETDSIDEDLEVSLFHVLANLKQTLMI